MTGNESASVVAYFNELWSKHELSPAVMASFTERLLRIPIGIEQAKAAMGEMRLNSKWRTPDLGEVLRRMNACRAAAGPADGVASLSPWKLRGFQLELPGRYDEETIIAVWFWRLAKRAIEAYGYEPACSALVTNHVCTLVDELGWSVADARAASAQRWGFDKVADEFLDRRYAA